MKNERNILGVPWRGRADYAVVNTWFSAVCFALPPILGSAVSFLYNGGALWSIFEILSGRRPLAKDTTVWITTAALACFVGAYIVAGLVNDDLFGHPSEYIWLLSLAVFPFSYSIWRLADKDDIASAVVWGSAVACCGGLVLALIQDYAIGIRPKGGSGNAIVFATVVALSGGIALAGAFRYKGVRRLILLLATVAAFAAVAYSRTRALWFAFLIVPFLVAWIWRSRFSNPKVFVQFVVATVMVIAGGLVIFEINTRRFTYLLANIFNIEGYKNTDTSLDVRIAIWNIGVRLFEEKPFFGHGITSARQLLSERLYQQYDIVASYTHFHNVFLTVGVESGLLGVAGLILVMVVPACISIGALRRSADDNQRLGAALILVMLVIFFTAGMGSRMLGHDILDAVFMISLVVGVILISRTESSAE